MCFIYHASGYMIIKQQVAINATETVKEKITFYREAQSQGVTTKRWKTANGVFNASYFMETLLKKQQNIRFSGAGASYKNGEAEHVINAVVTMTRTMLMHAALWFFEGTVSTDVWPMEMEYTVWVYNQIPYMQYRLPAIEIIEEH